MEAKIHPVMAYGVRCADAIACLRQHDHIEQTLLVLYAGIDTMAWLSVPEEESSGLDFQRWVQDYMLSRNGQLLPNVTAADLWGARCGLLHTGAPESRDFRKGRARKLFYTNNVEIIATMPTDIAVVSIENLGRAFASALVWFIDDLEANTAQNQIAKEMLGRTLVTHPM